MAVVRRRATALAAKIETQQGVDAFAGSPSAATDFIKGDISVTYNQASIANTELSGGLDASASIAGGTKVQVEITCMLKGSGTQGVAPQWGTLIQACGYQQTITSTAIGAPTAATAGTSTSATLATPFAATSELYRGMPITLSGNPATPITVPVVDYTAGRAATFGYNFPTPLSASTLAIIPPNVLYSPTSLRANIKSLTFYVYMDTILWRVVGNAGTFGVTMPTGQPGMIKFTFTGQFVSPVAQTVPPGLVFDATVAPVFRGGVCRLNGQLARTNQLTFDCGNTLFEPENPEATEGFDPSEITVRDTKGTMDPLMNSTDTIARVAAFKSGVLQTVCAVLGVIPGNQIAFSAPTVTYTGFSPQNRSDAMAEQIPFDCSGVDSSLFVSVF